jgi:hypothetical protein
LGAFSCRGNPVLRTWAGLAIGVVVLLLLSSGSLAPAQFSSTVTAVSVPDLNSALQSAGASKGFATVTVASTSQAQPLSPSFWGVDVVAGYGFGSSNAAQIAATPATYLRFPGGVLGEEMNYTSSNVTATNGKNYTANTTVKDFVTACDSIHCKAILQLPAEIDQPQTAAYYASYVVHTLGLQPAYWEIGNSVPGWTHFRVPWANWGNGTGVLINATLFAQLVATYITAVKVVDPSAHFLALGAAMGQPGYDQAWVTALAQIDGHTLSGISVHSYTMGKAPANPTVPQLLANLNGNYSLPDQVTADRSYIAAACPNCTSLSVFVTEANVAETNNYTVFNPTFAGALYVSADTAQALDLRLANLDWYCYMCNFSGSWVSNTSQPNMQYTLMSRVMTMLGNETLATTVTGLSTLYAAGTYGSAGLSLLLVNTNVTQTASFPVRPTGILSYTTAIRERWSNGSAAPHRATIKLGNQISVPPLTVEILQVPASGLAGSPRAVAPPHSNPFEFDRPSSIPLATPLIAVAGPGSSVRTPDPLKVPHPRK